MDPLIITLAIDPQAQARFDAERERWFPAGRTAVGAHVTLFHALPGRILPEIAEHLVEVCGRPPFEIRIDAVVPLGRGVAYRVVSDELGAVHAAVRARWTRDLTGQDAQGFRPHITVQNKVEPAVARATLATISSSFRPFEVTAVGLELWRYVGGPWEPLGRVGFDAA